MSSELVFSNFVLRVHERQLLADGRPLTLGARAFDVLAALVARAGQLVSKSDLLDLVWPGLVVEENNLQVHISTLRKVLGPELIATIPGRGYRFTARVVTSEDKDAKDVAPAASATSSVAARSIAVLRFANHSTDADQEYLSDGLAEDIIAKLTRSPWLYVIARNSSFAWRVPDTPVGEVCRALGARYLVTGSVRRSGNTVRISAELVDGPRNETLWTKRFDRPLDDLFEVQNEISTSIVSAIEPVYLRREESLTTGLAAPDMQHWERLMRARWHFWRTTREHIEQSREHLQKALELKPDDPASLSLMAFTHMSRVWAGWSTNPREDIVEANRLALRAVRQADTDANAHFTLGTALSFTGNIPQAIAELEYALTLYPEFASAAGELGRLLAFAGRTQEAVEYVLQAADASPHDPHLSLWIRTRALANYIDGNYPDAVRYASQATAKRPDWFFNHYLLAACHAAAGQMPEAQRAIEDARAFGPYPVQAVRMGHPFVDERLFERFTGHLREAGWSG